MDLRKLLYLGFLMGIVAVTSSYAANSASPKATASHAVHDDTVSSTWIVVNLFTGKSSRQAVLVRDTLARLGAEGRGIVLPYNEITVENMRAMRPAFLALSPNGIPWCKYKGKNGAELQAFFKALPVIAEELQIPMIGICGGHQAIALAFGGKVGPIKGGEDDCFPYGHNPTERGRHNLEVLMDDPLFHDMGKTINLVQNHYDEVKKTPSGFMCLANNQLCKYQIIRHSTLPVYGVQAHTEYFMNSRPDGGILLKNFLKIAKTHNQIARSGPAKIKESRVDSEKPKLETTAVPW